MPKKVRKKKIIRSLRRRQHWFLFGLIVIFIVTLSSLLWRFYYSATVPVPAATGTYIEGAVGELKSLNPWFTVQNDVNRDMVSLIFAGLLHYNPETKQIEEDLASLEVSRDARVYTVRIHEGIEWHDSTQEQPHYVSADDILFTYKTIQDPAFPNPLLQQNFQGVQIDKLDDRTVRFALEESYSFFESNLTLGLLPAASFEGIPVGKLDQTFGFGFQPVGAGPYAFKRLTQTEISTEVTLERFDRSIGHDYLLKQIIFRIFPDYPSLLSDLHSLQGVRHVPRNDAGEAIVPGRFTALHYTLPQYVALFFNTERSALQDQQLRLGLQLGTDKSSLVDSIGESVIVDTPLLEIDTSDWRYQFDPSAAQGALYESNWHLPEKLRLQRLLEVRDANVNGTLQISPVVLLGTGASLTITGSMTTVANGSTVNGVVISTQTPNPGEWSVQLPTEGTGALSIGQNVVRFETPEGRRIDTYYLERTDQADTYKRLLHEQTLVDQFLTTRDGSPSDDENITVADLALEHGILRERSNNDDVGTRMNAYGESLKLTLLTSPSPPVYQEIAEQVREQWSLLGVQIDVNVPSSRAEFEDQLLRREYDILLYGQSLLDNLDSYPYWHSSGIQTATDSQHQLRIDAFNLSQYRSLRADTLLEFIRVTINDKERRDALNELRDILKDDVPAIFLYSPLYTYAHQQGIAGGSLRNLSLHSDRFLTLHSWYTEESRSFLDGKSWWSFLPWLFSL